MKDETRYIERLEAHDVKPTALRILLLRTMMAHDDAFSLQSLEDELDTVDKSTIYRTITLFLTHHLIHAIDDGTGMFKYACAAPTAIAARMTAASTICMPTSTASGADAHSACKRHKCPLWHCQGIFKSTASTMCSRASALNAWGNNPAYHTFNLQE